MKYLLSCHWLCALVGCNEDDASMYGHPGSCTRCGCSLYDYGYVLRQHSLLYFIPFLIELLGNRLMMIVTEHYCEVCHKRLNSRQEYVCDNDTCWQNWAPF